MESPKETDGGDPNAVTGLLVMVDKDELRNMTMESIQEGAQVVHEPISPGQMFVEPVRHGSVPGVAGQVPRFNSGLGGDLPMAAYDSPGGSATSMDSMGRPGSSIGGNSSVAGPSQRSAPGPSQRTPRGNSQQNAMSPRSAAGARRLQRDNSSLHHVQLNKTTSHNLNLDSLDENEGPGRFGSIKFLGEDQQGGMNHHGVTATNSSLPPGGIRVSIEGNGGEDDDLDVLGNLFDLTPYRLQLIFNIIQEKDPACPVDELMAIPYVQFSEGLKKFGLGIDGEAFQTLVNEVDADGSGDITFNEFEVAVQRLKLEYLFREATVDRYETQREAAGLAEARLNCLDYSPAHFEARLISSAEMWRWACESRPKWARMRWISVEGQGDELLLQRLAVKYRLHPLSVEDALEDTGAKVDKYDNGYIFVCLPTLEVFEELPMELQNGEESYKRVTRNSLDKRHKAGVGSNIRASRSSRRSSRRSSLVGSPVKLSGGEGGGASAKSAGAGSEEPVSYQVLTSQIAMFLMFPKYDTFLTVTADSHTGHLVRTVREKIETNDMLRQYDASYLLYRVMDAVVDNLVVAGKFFRRLLRSCREDLRHEGPNFRIQRVDGLTRELNKVIRFARPLARVVKHCIVDDDISSNCTLYLGDVEDHLGQLMDELSELLNECTELQADFKYKRDERTARLMYLFTVVATVFLPAQFITGVFGMNYQHMPELEWRHGYRMFWVGLAFYFSAAAFVLWKLKPGLDTS